ncbi:uncharacterized protein LOC119316775 [Triticum dicoccoides]|uniref:uncharacterized protein LOC119316775 n=1 Tax=Triticum dicoccoides TaxID=85692 RepID=UPI001890E1B7|nr:uncharacterized protein LOC119316775 [Triticum dicoccoides]
MFDGSVNFMVANHGEIQKTTKLLTLLYLHNHLLEHDVGKHMPRLEKHLNMINMLLSGGTGGPSTSTAPLLPRVLDGLFGGRSSFSGTPWNRVRHNIREPQSTLVLNHVPIRLAPVNLPVARPELVEEQNIKGTGTVQQTNGSAFSSYGGDNAGKEATTSAGQSTLTKRPREENSRDDRGKEAAIDDAQLFDNRDGVQNAIDIAGCSDISVNASPKRPHADIETKSGGKELIVYTATRCRRARLEPNYLMRERHVHSDLPLAENPFHYNKRIEFPSRRTAKELYDRLLFSDSTTTKKLWFVHTIPTLLKISGSELIECFQEFGLFTRLTSVLEGRWMKMNADGME